MHNSITSTQFAERLRPTSETTFVSCEGSHAPLLEVPAGIGADEALRHAERHLHSAQEIAIRVFHVLPSTEGAVHRATVWAVDAAGALVHALIHGANIEQSLGVSLDSPPCDRRLVTATTALGSDKCGVNGPSMFSVRRGVLAEDALVHASLYLKAAYATADEICRRTAANDQGLHWALLHSIEAALALVEALQGEVYSTRTPGAEACGRSDSDSAG